MNDTSPLDDWFRSVDELLAAETEAASQPPLFKEEQGETPELIGKLWGRLRKEHDLEFHVRVGWVFGTEYLQFLDFQPSTGRYENAVLVEQRLLGRLLRKLTALHRYGGGTVSSLR